MLRRGPGGASQNSRRHLSHRDRTRWFNIQLQPIVSLKEKLFADSVLVIFEILDISL